jgi:hypothetical protein
VDASQAVSGPRGWDVRGALILPGDAPVHLSGPPRHRDTRAYRPGSDGGCLVARHLPPCGRRQTQSEPDRRFARCERLDACSGAHRDDVACDSRVVNLRASRSATSCTPVTRCPPPPSRVAPAGPVTLDPRGSRATNGSGERRDRFRFRRCPEERPTSRPCSADESVAFRSRFRPPNALSFHGLWPPSRSSSARSDAHRGVRSGHWDRLTRGWYETIHLFRHPSRVVAAGIPPSVRRCFEMHLDGCREGASGVCPGLESRDPSGSNPLVKWTQPIHRGTHRRHLADLHGVLDVKDRSEERSPRSFTGA